MHTPPPEVPVPPIPSSSRGLGVYVILIVLVALVVGVAVFLIIQSNRANAPQAEEYNALKNLREAVAQEYLGKYRAMGDRWCALAKALPVVDTIPDNPPITPLDPPCARRTALADADCLAGDHYFESWLQNCADPQMFESEFRDGTSSGLLYVHICEIHGGRNPLSQLIYDKEAEPAMRARLNQELDVRYVAFCKRIASKAPDAQLSILGAFRPGETRVAVYLVDLKDGSLRTSFIATAKNSERVEYQKQPGDPAGSEQMATMAIRKDLERHIPAEVWYRLEQLTKAPR